MGTIDLKQVTIERYPSGKPRKIRGDMPLPKAKTTEAAVSEFLKSNGDELQPGLDHGAVQLVHKAETPTLTVLRYQQVIGAVPVFNSQIIVQADKNKNVTQVEYAHVVGDTGIAPGSATAAGKGKDKPITAKVAYDAALKSLGQVTLRKLKPAPEKMYLPTDAGLRLTYMVMILTQQPMHDWRVFVDAKTKEILAKEDIIKSFPDGTGRVFNPNPVVTANNNTFRQPTATMATCGFAGTALATIDGQRQPQTLKDLTLSGGVHSLDGPFAKVMNIDAPTSTIPTEANANNFTYSSSDERFGAVNLYYHIDTVQRYLQSIGLTSANNRKTQADPVVTTLGYSAFYSPTDKSLHMGISRPCHPDKAQDADAIVHEYGHAIQDNQVPGWGGTNAGTGRNETGAMGEGFGDTLACVFFASFGNQFQRETFEDWAFVENGAAGLRRVDGTKIYPTDWHAEVHDDGEIWSSALWNIYRAIGGDSMNLADRDAARAALLKTVISSHHRLSTTATMPEGAEAVMNEHAALDDYRGQYLMQMLNSFHDRHLLRCDAAADLWMHDDVTDPGTEPFGGSVFWESPDLWVRNADDGGTTHQDPEFGQDNWFYARVRNRGTAPARAFVVTFNVKPWAGVQFLYPGDFIPFISAVPGFNLAPGASTIVKAKWPKGSIPSKDAHACLLGQVYMPTDTSPAGSHVWNKNNLAQRNMTVLDAVANDTLFARFQLGTLHERRPDIYKVELVRPPSAAKIRVSMTAGSSAETKKLFNSIDNWKPPVPVKPTTPASILRFNDFSSVELSGGATGVLRVSLAPGSSINYGAETADAPTIPFERTARLVETGRTTEIEFNEGRVSGFPVLFQPSSQLSCVLKIEVPKDARPGDTIKLQVIQRMSDGKIAGGITVIVNVKKQ